MKLLITGAAGFIGSHALKYFAQMNHFTSLGAFQVPGLVPALVQLNEIVVLDSLNYAAAFDRIEWARDKMTFVLHDLRAPLPDRLIGQIGEVDYVLHFAAETHVDRSLVDPQPFIDSNIMGTYHLLEFCRLHQPRLKMFFYVSTDEVYGPANLGENHTESAPHRPSNPYSASKAAAEDLAYAWDHSMGVPTLITNCWDMNTRVLTSSGPKKFDEVEPGMLAWTIDDDGRMILEPIGRKVRMRGPDEMIEIHHQKVNQLVTPNHRMMIQRCSGHPRRWGKVEEVSASDLINLHGRVRVPTTGSWHCAVSHLVRMPPVTHFNQTKLPSAILAETALRLMGWFISEGCAPSWVAFGAASKERQTEIASLLASIGLRSKISSHRRGVICHSVLLGRWFAQCGRGAAHKIIPQWCLQYKPELLRTLWESLMAGDGSFYHNKLGNIAGGAYYTKSEALAWQMCELGMKIGFAVRVSRRMTKHPSKNIWSEGPIVRFRLPKAEITRQHVRKVHYVGDVWCVSVPSGKVFVERDGVISLSGQTMNNIGPMQHREKFIPKIIRSLLHRSPITVHGSPDLPGSRKYLFAPDHADALHFLMSHGRRGERYNVVGSEEVTNLEMVRRIEALLGPGYTAKIQFVDFHATRPGHDWRYSLDGAKMAALGWTPPTPLTQALATTVKWALDHPTWLD